MKEEEKKYILSQLDKVDDIGEISDGYHTFNSLYNQRLYLFAALVNAYPDKAWKTKRHDDGELCFGGGWFLVGITTPAGNYTYHYELKHWGLFHCNVLDKAPEFDGHTDKDVTRVMGLQPVKHPRWVDFNKKSPKCSEIDDESDYCIVIDQDGYMNVATYNCLDGVWYTSEGSIVHVSLWLDYPVQMIKD